MSERSRKLALVAAWHGRAELGARTTGAVLARL
jgi:hypothetical protein